MLDTDGVPEGCCRLRVWLIKAAGCYQVQVRFSEVIWPARETWDQHCGLSCLYLRPVASQGPTIGFLPSVKFKMQVFFMLVLYLREVGPTCYFQVN